VTRPALVDVRPSTRRQVRAHTARPARQDPLAPRARARGWSDALMVVIDHDPGRSGAATAGRDGGASLLPDVGRGRAGAVVCWAASRVARARSDWERLMAIGAVTDTLGIDAEGVSAPGQSHARWR